MKKLYYVLFLFIVLLSLSACNNKGLQGGRAPVYQGMTVSDANILQTTDLKNLHATRLKWILV